jgi:hypothetical protein
MEERRCSVGESAAKALETSARPALADLLNLASLLWSSSTGQEPTGIPHWPCGRRASRHHGGGAVPGK